MKNLMTIILLLSMIIINSCTSSVVSPVQWTPQDEGIVLNLYANKKLHNEKGIPEQLDIIVYQLNDPASFNKLIEDDKSIYKMLKNEKFDSSVVCMKKIKVSPGSRASYKIDRAYGASHVAIVAGYNVMEKAKTTRLYTIPVFVKKERFFSSVRKLVPGRLDIKVGLGTDKIECKEVFADKKPGFEKEMGWVN